MSWKDEVEKMTTREIKINLARGYKGSKFKTLLDELSKRKDEEISKPKPVCDIQGYIITYRQSKVILNNIEKVNNFVEEVERNE